LKIALFQPDNSNTQGPFIPLGLLRIAGSLLNEGHDVSIFDNQYQRIDLKILSSYDFIGFTCMGPQDASSLLMLASRLREYGNKCPFIWGGALPTMIPELMLKETLVDFVVAGHGEEEIISIISSNKSSYKNNHNKPITPNWVPLSESLHPLPYNLIQMNKYSVKMGVPIQLSRGCNHSCEFCYLQEWNKSCLSHLPIELVFNEMKYVFHRFGRNHFCFVDDNFFSNKDIALGLCEKLLIAKEKMIWEISARADDLNKMDLDELKLLSLAGCFRIHIGAESGSNEELMRMNKQIQSDEIIGSIDKCRLFSIDCQLNFILGYYDTTLDDIIYTMNIIRKLDSKINIPKRPRMSVFTPWPGTPAYFKAIERGFNPPKNLNEWINYKFFDLPQLGIHNNSIERLLSALLYSDFLFREMPITDAFHLTKLSRDEVINALLSFEPLLKQLKSTTRSEMDDWTEDSDKEILSYFFYRLGFNNS
jgi:radical SAM superfamily enzyme YgiQ (UPF0313 family)